MCDIIAVARSFERGLACTGSSSTPLHIGHSRSSSTSPWNLVTSYPMVHYWDPKPAEQHATKHTDNPKRLRHGCRYFRHTHIRIFAAYLAHKRPGTLPFISWCVADTSYLSAIICPETPCKKNGHIHAGGLGPNYPI